MLPLSMSMLSGSWWRSQPGGGEVWKGFKSARRRERSDGGRDIFKGLRWIGERGGGVRGLCYGLEYFL